MKATDTSRYATGNNVVPGSAFKAMQAAGVQLFIPGAWHGIEGYDAVEASLNLGRTKYGLYTATYAALAPGWSGKNAIEKTRELCGAEWGELAFCAVDVETPGITHKQISEAVEQVAAFKQIPVIYTARYAWEEITGNSEDFRWVRLWNALYDDDPDIDFLAHPFGGWTLASLAGEQYANSTPFGGIDVDFSTFSDEFIRPALADPANPLVVLRDAWQRDMADLTKNTADLVARVGDDIALALHTLYTENRQRGWHALLGGGK